MLIPNWFYKLIKVTSPMGLAKLSEMEKAFFLVK